MDGEMSAAISGWPLRLSEKGVAGAGHKQAGDTFASK
jgi:hypothetical protein